MSGGHDLDPYEAQSTAGPPVAAVARGLGRALGIVVGLAIAAYGAALYALRCFDTCPSDPAEDKIIQLLTASIVLFGLILITGAASVGTRWFRQGTWVVTILGAAIGLAGAGTLALVPSLRTPGDHSNIVLFGVIALGIGASVAIGSLAVRKRLLHGSRAAKPADAVEQGT